MIPRKPAAGARSITYGSGCVPYSNWLWRAALSIGIRQRFCSLHASAGRLGKRRGSSLLICSPCLKPLITRLATCEGMRPGEILAVRIGDVDLAEDCVWIRRRVYRGKLGDPKND